jgi:CubicO group peptidase (beta-lactamase class C family)
MRPLVFALGLAGLAAAFQQVPLAAPQPTALLSADFDTFAAQLLEDWAVPGLSLGVVKVGGDGQLQTEFHEFRTGGKGRKVDENVRLFGLPFAPGKLTICGVDALRYR